MAGLPVPGQANQYKVHILLSVTDNLLYLNQGRGIFSMNMRVNLGTAAFKVGKLPTELRRTVWPRTVCPKT